MNSAVVKLMTDSNELTMDVSGAWVREASPMLATSRLFSPKHLGSLPYTFDPKAAGDRDKQQIRVPFR